MAKGGTPESKRLGAFIEALMNAKRLTQTELANRIGVEQSYISQLKRGMVHLPGAEILQALADALGTNEVELLRLAGYIRPRNAEQPSLRPALQEFNARVQALSPNVQDKVAYAGMAVIDAVGETSNNITQDGDIRMRDVPEAARPIYEALREMIGRLPRSERGEATA